MTNIAVLIYFYTPNITLIIVYGIFLVCHPLCYTDAFQFCRNIITRQFNPFTY